MNVWRVTVIAELVLDEINFLQNIRSPNFFSALFFSRPIQFSCPTISFTEKLQEIPKACLLGKYNSSLSGVVLKLPN